MAATRTASASERSVVMSRGTSDVCMDEAHRHRPFTNGRCHALHGPATNIACGEDSGKAGLEQERRAGSGTPAIGARLLRGGSEVPVSTKPFLSRATQPRSQLVFASAPVKRKSELVSICCSSPFRRVAERTQMPVAVELRDLRAAEHRDVLQSQHLVDQIARHLCAQV